MAHLDAAVATGERLAGHQPGHLSAGEPQRPQLLDRHRPILAPAHHSQPTLALHPALGAFLVLGTSNPPRAPPLPLLSPTLGAFLVLGTSNPPSVAPPGQAGAQRGAGAPGEVCLS
jgi:hypothetical protein